MPHAMAIATASLSSMDIRQARVYRMMPAPATSPVVIAGRMSDINAARGACQPASGNPCDGRIPISPTPRPNSIMSNRPLHNAGTAPPTIAIVCNTLRTRGLPASTAWQPIGIPMPSATSRLSTISGKVIAACEPICEATVRPLIADTPIFPCSKPPNQSAYCCGYERSSPIRERIAATRAGVAFVPAITDATSPGRMRSAAKTSRDRPNKATANHMSRRIRYLIAVCSSPG